MTIDLSKSLLDLEDLDAVADDALTATLVVIYEELDQRLQRTTAHFDHIDTLFSGAPTKPAKKKHEPGVVDAPFVGDYTHAEILNYADDHGDSAAAKHFGLKNAWAVKALRKAEHS